MKLTMTMTAVYLLSVISWSGSPAVLQAQAAKSQWSGVYTPAQATRGEALYAVVCAYCHGLELEGGSGGADVGPELKGAEFMATWNKKSIGDLFGLIVQSMPQDRPGSVTPAETADLVAFVLSKNDAPAGAVELPSDPAALAAIGFVSTKP